MPSQKTLDRFEEEREAEAAAFAEEMLKKSNPLVRTFSTGATRDLDENKLDFEGFLSPLVLEEFAKYMHGKRKMPDGTMRDSDNWQRGMGRSVYMKSMFRHFFAVWKGHRAGEYSTEELCALLFNVQGMLHEVLLGREAA
jgi:hypothetical protein